LTDFSFLLISPNFIDHKFEGKKGKKKEKEKKPVG
jgi:hypothetical protein